MVKVLNEELNINYNLMNGNMIPIVLRKSLNVMLCAGPVTI